MIEKLIDWLERLQTAWDRAHFAGYRGNRRQRRELLKLRSFIRGEHIVEAAHSGGKK